MHLVEIFLPAEDNGGNIFPAERFTALRADLTQRFASAVTVKLKVNHDRYGSKTALNP